MLAGKRPFAQSRRFSPLLGLIILHVHTWKYEASRGGESMRAWDTSSSRHIHGTTQGKYGPRINNSHRKRQHRNIVDQIGSHLAWESRSTCSSVDSIDVGKPGGSVDHGSANVGTTSSLPGEKVEDFFDCLMFFWKKMMSGHVGGGWNPQRSTWVSWFQDCLHVGSVTCHYVIAWFTCIVIQVLAYPSSQNCDFACLGGYSPGSSYGFMGALRRKRSTPLSWKERGESDDGWCKTACCLIFHLQWSPKKVPSLVMMCTSSKGRHEWCQTVSVV